MTLELVKTITDLEYGKFREDANNPGKPVVAVQGTNTDGSIDVQELYAPKYEDNVAEVAKVEQRYTPTYISTATTTTVKSGSGFLHRLIVNGGTTGTITVYDNTAASGTIIASLDTTNTIASYEFNVTFSTGLTIVTSAATKLTVAWR